MYLISLLSDSKNNKIQEIGSLRIAIAIAIAIASGGYTPTLTIVDSKMAKQVLYRYMTYRPIVNFVTITHVTIKNLFSHLTIDNIKSRCSWGWWRNSVTLPFGGLDLVD